LTLRDMLRDKRDAIARTWLEEVLATYPAGSAALFARESDPFANPVGHSLRLGTERILDALLDGTDVEEIREHLLAVMKIRAVQQFAPSQAAAFVLRLREIVRAALGGVAADPESYAELAKLDAQIDRIALVAFDAYVACREQVHELRINEVKRQVSWVLDRMNRRDPDLQLVQIEPKPEREGDNLRREDLR
jgi:hypothetical protein